MRSALAALAVAGCASMALGQAQFDTGAFSLASPNMLTFTFEKDGTGEAVDGFSIFIDYVGDGGNTWASDTNCVITAPDGQSVAIGGFGSPSDLDYDYQGSVSANPGTYTSGPHFGWIDGGPADGVYTVKLTQDFGIGIFNNFQVNILRGGGGGDDDCGLKKSPDQGAFWQPLDPNSGSYVYANSFVPCSTGDVGEIGTWLLDQAGTGGPDIRFEVWGSIGGDPANGPDAGNVIASTGSLSLPGTPNLDFYSAPATTTGTISAGTTYWFVATVVGEGGDGSWQLGGHTQNSEGIVDNGTFWFSNDPAGINFDGQGFTPELAFCVTTSVGIGENAYYVDSGVAPWGSGDYAAAMDTVFGPGNWSAATYADDAASLLADAGFLYLEGSDSSASELNDWLGANAGTLESWVSSGGKLLMNAAPNEGGNIDFGFGGVLLTYPDFDGADIANAVDPAHPVFNGPFGVIATSYTGTSFSHSTLSGGGISAIMVNGAGNTVVAELGFNGVKAPVVFGAMTAPQFHDPDPDSQILLENIIAYAAGEGDVGCFADCDGNGALNILDFVCYQGLFQAGDPGADCDGNGVLNILDFVCFQGAFQAGCP